MSGATKGPHGQGHGLGTLRRFGDGFCLYSLEALEAQAGGEGGRVSRLPRVKKILLEGVLRNGAPSREALDPLLGPAEPEGEGSPQAAQGRGLGVAFVPGRVLLQDFTGVPCLVDLATLREEVVAGGGRGEEVEPRLQADLVVDHSVQVDAFGSKAALTENERLERERNEERYRFLRWKAQTKIQGYRFQA